MKCLKCTFVAPSVLFVSFAGRYLESDMHVVNFINILRTRFSYKILAPKMTKSEIFGFETFWQKDIGEKRARKMLLKFSPDVLEY
jgi:hypothetical protein